MADEAFRVQVQHAVAAGRLHKARPPAPVSKLKVDCCDSILAREDVIIHVSTSGNDDGAGTAEAPLRTFEEAVRRLRPLWQRKQQILLEPGEYVIKDELYDVYVGRQVGADAEPLTIRGGFSSEGGTRTVTGVSGDTVSAAEDLGATDALAGARLRFVDGQAKDDAYLIVANTNDAVRVAGGLNRSPGTGAHFVIERPNVTIVHEGFMGFDGTGRTALVLEGIRFRANSQGPLGLRAFELSGGMQVYARGCEWDLQGGIFQVIDHCALNSGTPLDPGAPQGNDGCFLHDGHRELGFRSSLGSVFGHWYVQDVGINGQGAGILEFWSLNGLRTPVMVDGTYGAVTVSTFAPSSLRDAPGIAVKVTGPGACLLFRGVSIAGARRDAIVVDERAYARLEGVTGSGNGGAGVKLGEAARVVADRATTVTGSKDIDLAGKPFNWLDLGGEGGISDAQVFSRIDRGILAAA